MIKKLILGIVLGVAAIVTLAPFDPWVKERAGQLFLSVFRNNFHCSVSGHVESLTIFPASLTMRDLTLTCSDSSHGTWQWKAQRYETGFSWSYLLFTQVIDMWVVLHGLQATSDMHDGAPSIVPHLQELMRGPVLSYPLMLKTVQVYQARTILQSEWDNEFEWNGTFKKIDDTIRSQLYITSGSIAKKDRADDLLIHNMSGTLSVHMPANGSVQECVITVDGRSDLPQLGSYATCFITGNWRDGRGKFQLQSIDQQLRIYPLTIYPKEGHYYCDATVSIPLSYMSHLLSDSYPSIGGNCVAQITTSLDPQGEGIAHFICENFSHALLLRKGLIKGHITKKGMAVSGSTELRAGAYEWKSSFSWDGATRGECHIENKSRLARSGLLWQIPKHGMTADIRYDAGTKKIEGSYQATAKHTMKEQEIALSGSCLLDEHRQLKWQGQCGDYHHEMAASLADDACMQSCTLVDGRKRSLMACAYQNAKRQYEGSIDLIWLRNAASALFNIDIQAEGTLGYSATVQDRIIDGTIEMHDATVRLPQTLNFIERCAARVTCDLAQRSITIRDAACSFHAGSIATAQATVWLDEFGDLQFVHIPIVLDHCLVTAKQDLFAMISGAILIEKKKESDILLRGNIIVERCQLKENIFSPEIQKRLFSSSSGVQNFALPITTDITIETKDPIRVDTNFLQANAHLALHVQGCLTNPIIEGSCSISEGSICFPYKPLFITKGEITFLKDQPLNPVVEIIAKNKIKNHHVALHVTGSLKEHMVLLDATPPLTEGQIVSLLVAGAHEESLQALLPTLLMQNVTNYIFSSHQSNFFERHIKPWMKRINVQLIPNFTQQSGRGGLRGALEVTINDRWRALIEKNFSLSEDTRFELEYVLSDDITFRLVRDERCDISAEVEMKWKF